LRETKPWSVFAIIACALSFTTEREPEYSG